MRHAHKRRPPKTPVTTSLLLRTNVEAKERGPVWIVQAPCTWNCAAWAPCTCRKCAVSRLGFRAGHFPNLEGATRVQGARPCLHRSIFRRGLSDRKDRSGLQGGCRNVGCCDQLAGDAASRLVARPNGCGSCVSSLAKGVHEIDDVGGGRLLLGASMVWPAALRFTSFRV